MKISRLIVGTLATIMITSCEPLLAPVSLPDVDLDAVAASYPPLPAVSRTYMDGVYAVQQSDATFGDTVVMRWVRDRYCLYANNDVVFAELAGGIDGNEISFDGYFRFVRGTRAERMRLSVAANEGASQLIAGEVPPVLVLRGTTGDEENMPVFRATRVRALSATRPRFYIAAHRGGGRNSERLGISENSLKMVRFAEFLGANAIEIDVMSTRDRVAIVFHDKTFSPRTIQGAYILGDVQKYSWAEISRYARLTYGEPVPSLREMLRYAIDSTSHELIWLDVKDAGITDSILVQQREALEYAASIGRTVRILFGIPDTGVLDAYRKSSYSGSLPVLCELDMATFFSLEHAEVWAPRWSLEISDAEIENVRKQGKNVIIWTIDVGDYMRQYLTSTSVDGILTNYPSMLTSLYYEL